MAILQQLSILAVQQVLEGACQTLGISAGAQAGESVVGLLTHRFIDHSQKLSKALTRANEQAWRALEIALAGDSWWERVKVTLSRSEDQGFREQVQAFLASTPVTSLAGHEGTLRQTALQELRTARKAGLLDSGGIDPQALARQTGRFARFADPKSLLQAQEHLLHEMAGLVREAGYPALARLLTLRTEADLPLLVVAARYFFRREVETDRELFQGLAFNQLERLSQAQEAGLAGLAALGDALARHGSRFETLFDEMQQVVHGLRSDIQQQSQHLNRLGQSVVSALEQHQVAQRLASVPDSKPKKSEQDLRLDLLNTLLKTPHRQLDELWPLHSTMVTTDPLFYVHLAAWYREHGEVRDHKEMFVITLCLSSFEGHREVGLALLRALPPFQLVRLVDFIHGVKETRLNENGVREVVAERGLQRNLPRSLKTEIVRYLREREVNPEWFDSTVLIARKAIKRLYALLHIAPGERAQQILFDDNPPADSRLHGLKKLAQATTPLEMAEVIARAKIPFRIAVSVLPEVTPTTLAALIERMSPMEVINNLALLQRRGAMTDINLKALIDQKLELAKKDKRVSTFKAEEAMKAVKVDSDTRQKLEEVADVQLKAKGRISRPTALLVDKSGSMELAIEIGKRLGAMISTICEKDLFVYAFDKLAYPIQAKGRDLASWNKAFQGITASGMTSCGVALEVMRRRKQYVEQIILVTDEEEYDPPYFVDALQRYRRELQADPGVCIVRVPESSTRLQEQCKKAGILLTTFDFNGDYYSLPNLVPLLEPPSELDLLMEIMEYPLPERKPVTIE